MHICVHICVGKLVIIGADNGLSPAVIWTNDRTLVFLPYGTNFKEILIAFHTFSFRQMHLKMSSGKWQPFCLDLNVLIMKWNANFRIKQQCTCNLCYHMFYNIWRISQAINKYTCISLLQKYRVSQIVLPVCYQQTWVSIRTFFMGTLVSCSVLKTCLRKIFREKYVWWGLVCFLPCYSLFSMILQVVNVPYH